MKESMMSFITGITANHLLRHYLSLQTNENEVFVGLMVIQILYLLCRNKISSSETFTRIKKVYGMLDGILYVEFPVC